ncbi:MAG: SulP family inorganic anion transporter [Flavisolibacter sp.]|nr:SulP family inorganic anion transporter [Flavisolibacter sp.]
MFQILLGVLKLGTIANYFPSAVIKGMLAAIGLLLIAKQIPFALGYDRPDFWQSGFLQLLNYENFGEHFHDLSLHTARITILITIISLAVMFFLQRSNHKKLKIIPAPLVVVLLGIFISFIATKFSWTSSLKPTQLVNIPDNIFKEIAFPDLSQLFSKTQIWKDGLIVGLLATLETLLCIEAIDKLDEHNRITPVNRELVAQGIGNVACGLLGAIPMTAVNCKRRRQRGCRCQNQAFCIYARIIFTGCRCINTRFVKPDSKCFVSCHSFGDRLQSYQTKIISQHVAVGVETIFSIPTHHHSDTGYRSFSWCKHWIAALHHSQQFQGGIQYHQNSKRRKRILPHQAQFKRYLFEQGKAS